MSRLTLRLPETLHQQLSQLADREGVSLNHYIVYALTRQATSSDQVQVKSEAEVLQQQEAFQQLKQRLGETSRVEVEAILAQRERVEPEADLRPDVVARLQKRLKKSV
jgi:L-alanine-DL-glutamate epimerase-like enolase superfamily enzyme